MPAGDAPTQDAPEAPSARRLWGLAGLAVLELAVAWAVARGLVAAGKALTPAADTVPADITTGGHDIAGMHDMAGMTGAAPGTGAVSVLLLVLCLTGVAVAVWSRASRSSQLVRESAEVGVATLGVVAAFLPASTTAAAGSHLAMMAQPMMLVLVAPALLASAVRPRGLPGRPLPRAATLGIAAAYAVVMVLWHLPNRPMAGPSVLALELAAFAVGLLLWFGVLGDERPETDRVRVLATYTAGVPAGLLGLALILSDEPFGHHGEAAALFGALADQRLGGVLMMLVEAFFLLPLLLRAQRADSGTLPQPTP